MTNVGVDMTLCLYQPLSYWLTSVEEKYGEEIAQRCREIIGHDLDRNVSDLSQRPSEIIKQAKSMARPA